MKKAIDATEKKFLKIDMSARFTDYGIDAEKMAHTLSDACCDDEKRFPRGRKAIDRDAVYSILILRA